MVRRGGENALPHAAAAGRPPHAPGDHTRALPKQALRVPRPPAWPLAMFPLVSEQNRQLSVCHSPTAVGTQPCVPGKDEFPENAAEKSQDRVLTGGRGGAGTRPARPSASSVLSADWGRSRGSERARCSMHSLSPAGRRAPFTHLLLTFFHMRIYLSIRPSNQPAWTAAWTVSITVPPCGEKAAGRPVSHARPGARTRSRSSPTVQG